MTDDPDTTLASTSTPSKPEPAPHRGTRSANADRPTKQVRRGIVSFVRRSPRMNESQQRAMDTLASTYLIDVPRDTTSTSVAPGPYLDLPGIFGRTAPVTVEIGTGAGTVLASLAQAHPDRDFIGFEVYLPSVASTLNKLHATNATNARVILADAAAGIDRLFAPQHVDEVWTFFPDPWRKRRHHKRRIVNPDIARLVASRLRPGGLWRLATDWDDYASWMVNVLSAEPLLEPVNANGFSPRWEERPLTRYEEKGLAAGRTVRDLTWRRVDES
ncbi:tRNA (guanosine(46)-N7)-methyltransferase TrmB [Cutibacterium sp.]|uniref:tRNA (guanosine(46)-N7)-methyltransferase TrmB n=1 Tax=Cutibacterium sp. TaxID=1912221 RepID=UPI0026DACD58|nr:tRNA (guanosine(46)-N7)-methyltransferase TrmB [Cutibacterium sp.]MDO4413136.1 tRNA (guanosine(46)-N7)-methyltransferase TrmB [Cutibacterium sp.]